MKSIIFLPSLLVLVSITFSTLDVSALGLNDVSYLMPLPKISDYNQTLTPDTVGAKGEILPFQKISHIQPLLQTMTNRELYPTLKIVGIRVDPCFTEGAGPTTCSEQIRLVWQPVIKNRNGYSTSDVSLHIFYQLTHTEFKSLIQQIKSLAASSRALPNYLTVNTNLLKEGYSGAYAQKLFSILKQFCGGSNIIRTTFMSLNLGGNVWTFGGYNFTADGLKVMVVPRLWSANQFFSNSSVQNPTKFKGGISPEPPGENLNELVKETDHLNTLTETQIKASVLAATRFENPLKHNAGTVDCVSCHIAQAARINTSRNFKNIDFNSLFKTELYQSTLNLTNQSPLQNQTNILRAFGYFNESPIVSQRTINESAEVVKLLNNFK